ncbi:MAG: hypothetical protein WDM96_04665 [Lacunisphaera sp.]
MKQFIRLALLLPIIAAAGAEPPYPPSPVIADITFDWSTHRREGQGSDNWQLTWADDGNLYGAWGDGGGFGRHEQRRPWRASAMAASRATGGDYRGFNVWAD